MCSSFVRPSGSRLSAKHFAQSFAQNLETDEAFVCRFLPLPYRSEGNVLVRLDGDPVKRRQLAAPGAFGKGD